MLAVAVAAIKPEPSRALFALTTAALSLPGLHAVAAIPAANVKTNISYGHYAESDNRMKVDVYHADAVIPLSDRIELSFSLDRDTYTGATPAFSLPITVTNLLKSEKTGALVLADLVSSASGGVTASGLTSPIDGKGIETFVDYQSSVAGLTVQLENTYASGKINLANTLSQDTQLRTAEYVSNLADIHPTLPNLFNSKVASEFSLRQNFDADVANYLNTQPFSITESKTVTFGSDNNVITAGAMYGKANVADGSLTTCAQGNCVVQDGMVVGTITDTSALTHLHQGGSIADRLLAYHNDSGGFFIRSQDLKAFSLDSIYFDSRPSVDNPFAIGGSGGHDPALDFFEVLGFNSATMPNLSSGDGTNYAERVAYQTIENGFVGTVNFNSQFRNVKSVWIHYKDVPNVASAVFPFKVEIDNITVSPISDWTTWNQGFDVYKNNLTAQYNADLAAINAQYQADRAALGLSTADQAELAQIDARWAADVASLNQNYQNSLAELEQFRVEIPKQSKIASYRRMIDSLVPDGTPTVQRFQWQPMETRSMPQFTAKYYFDATTLAVTGGLSDEPDFLSNFGSVNLSHEFNDKLTTISAGYGMTKNEISRNSSVHSSHHANDPAHNPTDYPILNESSTFNSFNTSIAQVLGKNTLFQSTINYSNQSGYLSNPYKFVYVRGEVTPEEYYQLSLANTPGEVDWNSITQLEMVGVELFRENRPSQRNLWAFSNQLNQHIPELNASAHLDYRFYTDDWGVNSHTLEFKWFQSLPGGFTVTPNIRYYSQSQADFFAPYFLAPRADGFYSSDFRLSAFGNLSGGVTVSKEFARGISLETGIEYTTHSGALKLGGGGVGSFADFDYFMAHANLNIELSARPFSIGSGAGDHAHHHHHHHGAPIPAGVMFGHMMNQADEIMVGYRFQYTVQSGSMLQGSDPVSDALLVNNACIGYDSGCLYKPSKMVMQMHMLDLMYAPTDWLNIMIMPQLMSMDMGMSQPLRSFQDSQSFSESEEYGHHAGTNHTSNDIGDTVVTALVKIMDDGKHHVHAGIGMSAPTGNISAELTPPVLSTSSGTATNPGSAALQDYGMQLGSGTWDFKPSLSYSGHLDDWGWGAQFSGVKRIGKNKHAYAYGDQFQATGWGSYKLFEWLSATVRGVYTWQDKIQGASNQYHETITPVDFPGNYGGRFWDVGLGLNASIPEGQFAGHNISVEWLQPVSSNFNGYQLDRDGALTATWSFAF